MRTGWAVASSSAPRWRSGRACWAARSGAPTGRGRRPVQAGLGAADDRPAGESFAPLYAGGLIAVEEINAAGGIMGRPIARIEEDDEASVAKSRR